MRKIILLMVTSIILSLNLSFVSAAEWNVVSKTEVAAKKRSIGRQLLFSG